MKDVILPSKNRLNEVELCKIDKSAPIFACHPKTGKLMGMVIEETEGWITRIGGSFGLSGHYKTLEKCLENDSDYYDFKVED